MKKLSLCVAIAITLFTSASASSNPKLYIIDLSGRMFGSSSFNVMDDGIPAEVQGFALKLDGEMGKDFSIEVKFSADAQKCKLTEISKSAQETFFRLEENLDVDGGETCEVGIVYRDGKRALLSIYSQGT